MRGSRVNRVPWWRPFILFTLAAICGCGGRATTGVKRETADTHLGAIAILVNHYESKHVGELPRDESDFREFAMQHGQFAADRIGVATVDELFASEADGQPLVLAFGSGMRKYRGADVIGYEQSVIDGKRLVAFRGGDAKFVDDVELNLDSERAAR